MINAWAKEDQDHLYTRGGKEVHESERILHLEKKALKKEGK